MLRCCARFPSCWLGRGESSIIDPVHRGPASRSALMARKASRRRPGRGAEHCPMSVSSLDYRFEANVFVTADLEQAPRRLEVEGGRGDQGGTTYRLRSLITSAYRRAGCSICLSTAAWPQSWESSRSARSDSGGRRRGHRESDRLETGSRVAAPRRAG